MLEGNLLALVLLGLVLGLRHGIDWDHIAAIADITSSASTTREARVTTLANALVFEGPGAQVAGEGSPREWPAARSGFFLATLYALGHASVVASLGLLAIWAGAVLPSWIDPVMERVVGATLVFLGVWIFYSLWRYGRSFRLQSRWMLLLSLLSRGWARVRTKISGHTREHAHEIGQYGSKTAFGIGMIHGVGAETGSQALVLAAAAGSTTRQSGSLILLSFVVGLIISNSLIAAFSAFGFVSSSAKRNVYVLIGALAGIFSLLVGAFFVTGQGARLPDLQGIIRFFAE